MRVDQSRRRRQRQIINEIAGFDFALPGSVEFRRTRCGQPGCRCHAEPPALHGPYIVWTRKVAGKTVSRTLTNEQLTAYQPWLDNARRLRHLVSELHDLTLEIVEEHHRSLH